MTDQAYPTLNGYAPSWADIETTYSVVGGALIDVSAFKEIKWSDKLEIGDQRGSGGRRKKRTTGQLSEEASAVFYRDGWRELKKKLIEKAPTRGDEYLIGLVGFDILIQHSPPGESDIYKAQILGCRIAGRDYSTAEGTDADTIAIALNPIKIIEIEPDGKKVGLI